MTRSSPAKTRRKANKSFVSPGTRKAHREVKDLIITKAATDLIGRTGENGRAPYGSMKKVLDRYSTYELSRSQVQRRVERIKSQASRRSLFVPNANDPAFPPPVDEIRIPGQIGSPQSLLTGPSAGVSLSPSTDSVHSSDIEEVRQEILREISELAQQVQRKKTMKEENLINNAIHEASKRQRDDRAGGKKGKGEFTKLLRDIEKSHDLQDNALDRHKFTIRKRAQRNNPSGRSESQTSPMESVEPTVVAFCIKGSRIGQPLTQDEVLKLALSLIEGTEWTARIIAWKKKYSQYDDSQPILGKGWYLAFKSRWKDQIAFGAYVYELLA